MGVILVPLVEIATPARADAQRVVSTLDVSGVAVGYADSLYRRSVSIAPAVLIDAPRASLNATGLFAQDVGGGWTAQGSADAALYVPLIPEGSWLRGEIGTSAGGSTHQDGTRTGELLARGRIHLVQASWGGWIGAGGGEAWEGTGGHSVVVGDAGAWFDASRTRFVATVTPVVIGQDTGGRIAYTDVQGTLRWAAPRGELSGTIGTRLGTDFSPAPADITTWGSASAVFWMLHSVAVVASAGTYPIDFAQGFPGGRYASIGIRLEARRGRAGGARVASGERAPSTILANDILRFEMYDTVMTRGTQDRVFRVQAPSSTSSVQLTADFTHWRPVALIRGRDGWWTLSLSVAPGVHQMNIRVNGGPWLIPPSLAPLTDEFGGTVGILEVH